MVKFEHMSVARPHVRQAKLSERGREGEKGRDRSVAPVRTPFARSLSLPLSIRFYFTTSVVVVVASLYYRRRQTAVSRVKYEPSVDAHCCCYVPFPLLARLRPKRGESPVVPVYDC